MRSVISFRSLAYFVYAVIITAVFLYVRFPSTKFKAYCQDRIEGLMPGSHCTIDHIDYRFPLDAVFKTIKIIRTVGGQESVLMIKSLAVSPKPLQFWKDYSLKGEMYSGTFGADLKVDRRTHSFQLTKMQMTGLEAGEFTKHIGLTDREMSGTVEFSGDYLGDTTQPSNGTGKGMVRIADGKMALVQPILAISTIDFGKIAVNVTQQNGVLRLAEGTLAGKDLAADFTGELRLTSPLINSNILLSGHLKPNGEFLRSHPREQQVVSRLLQRYKTTDLPFKVGGTVKRPLFRFSM